MNSRISSSRVRAYVCSRKQPGNLLACICGMRADWEEPEKSVSDGKMWETAWDDNRMDDEFAQRLAAELQRVKAEAAKAQAAQKGQ